MAKKKNLLNGSEKLAAHVANRLEKLLSPKIIGVELLRRGIYELLHERIRKRKAIYRLRRDCARFLPCAGMRNNES